ncbi:peptidoglycan recognition protein family protein [Bariatricus sp. SGI.154]|uniref:peptidoglycan recognition protein family protein n=1 Tax=Bariatricus sp. SGI.154 TaxID=3420549 RepID=UPI003D087106
MGYTNSSLVNCTVKSPNHSGRRTHSIDRITPHCVVGQLSAEGIGSCFPAGREASCNYGIGKDGRVCLIVDEANRSWCTSSNANDQRAVTIECASDTTDPYTMTNAVYEKLIKLCVDICKRNGKKKLLWFADKNKSLNYSPKADEMVLTVHRWFANKSCPGDWLYSRLGDVAKRVTAQLGGGTSTGGNGGTTGKLYRVRKTWADAKSQKGAFSSLENAKRCADQYKLTVFDESGNAVYNAGNNSTDVPFKVKITAKDLRIRKGAGDNTEWTKEYTGAGVFTIVEVKPGHGSVKGWGKLKSGAGWVSLDYCTRL